jgi:hypothetical protein
MSYNAILQVGFPQAVGCMLKLEAGAEQKSRSGILNVLEKPDDEFWLVRTRKLDGSLVTICRTRIKDATPEEQAAGVQE